MAMAAPSAPLRALPAAAAAPAVAAAPAAAAAAAPWPGAGGAGALLVTGCDNPVTAEVVRGTYVVHGENHGRRVFKKVTQASGGTEVFIYYWDDRDGPEMCGWWFGPCVGADSVWAFSGQRTAVPPGQRWHVPFGGPVDGTLQVRSAHWPAQQLAQGRHVPPPAAAAANAAAHAEAAKRKRETEEKARVANEEVLKKRKAEEEARRLEQEEKKREAAWREEKERQEKEDQELKQRKAQEEARRLEQEAVVLVKSATQKVRLATPENFDQLRQTLEEVVAQNAAKCGSRAEKVREEAVNSIEFARVRAEAVKEQRRKAEHQKQQQARLRKEFEEEKSGPPAPYQVEVAATAVGKVMGQSGSMVKRLSASTGCVITVQHMLGNALNGSVTVKLQGTSKARRVAAESLLLVSDGAEPEDVDARAKGACVVLHGLAHPGRQEWLTWRLTSCVHKCGFKPEVRRRAVWLWPAAAAEASAEPAVAGEPPAGLREEAETAVAEAQALAELTVETKAELEPTAAALASALAVVGGQYGVLAKALAPEEAVVPVLVLGPPDAARDAAALLWAIFVQGQKAAVVLQIPGAVQSMSEIMAKDFDGDLRALEEECEVEVHQTDVMLWVCSTKRSAEGAERAVARGQGMVRDMLRFYMPEDFTLLAGLKAGSVDKLRQDPELRSLVVTMDCVVALDGIDGTAWLCGPSSPRAAARRRVEALAPEAAEAPLESGGEQAERPEGAPSEGAAARQTAGGDAAAAMG